MLLLLSAVAVLIPLVITPGLLFYFDVTPKVVILLVGAAFTMQWIPQRITIPRPLWWFASALGVNALSLIVSTAASSHWQLSLIGTNWRRFGLLTQLALLTFAVIAGFALAGRPDRLRALLRSIVAGGILASAYGIGQYLGWDAWLDKSAYVIGEGEWAIVRPPSTLGYASYAATYYLFAVFAGIGLARIDPVRTWRTLGILAAGGGSLAIIMSGTRAALLGLLAGALLLVVAERPRLTLRRVSLLVVVLAAFAGFYLSPAGERLRGRVRWSMEDPRGGGRLLIWRDSLRMAAERPILGWGPETFYTEFPRVQSRELSKAYPDFYYESPHNIFLDAFVSNGIGGLAAFVALCGLAFYAAWVARKKAPVEAGILTAALAASIVAQQFTVFVVSTALCFYLAVAMLVSLAAPSPVALRRSWVGGAVSLLFLAFALRLSASDWLLAGSNRALDRGDLKTAAELYHRSQRWQAPGPGSDLWYSRALAKSAQNSKMIVPGIYALQEGFAAAERATGNAEDRHNALYNFATYCAMRDDFACVESSLRQTIQQAPNWFKPHWTLAQALKLAGRLSEAEAEAAVAVDLNAGKDPEVERTLEEIRTQRRGNGN